MENISPNSKSQGRSSNDASEKIKTSSYRGFTSIDQEMEREIAMQFFYPSKKHSYQESGSLAGKL
jgi:hypothetical protein